MVRGAARAPTRDTHNNNTHDTCVPHTQHTTRHPAKLGPDITAALHKAGINAVSVALHSADPEQFARLCQPDPALTAEVRPDLLLEEVRSFVHACCQLGIRAECATVARPDVDMARAEQLAGDLGASFRQRTFHDVNLTEDKA